MPLDLQHAWNRARLTEPFTVTSPTTGAEIGVFMLDADSIQIFSLDPAKDFPDLKVSAWSMGFRFGGQILGLASYFGALAQLRPYVMDLQNGNLLVRGLDPDEFTAVFKAAEGVPADQL